MNQNTTVGQETDDESADQLRSEYEQFSLAVCRGAVGFVNVRNDSYGDDSGSHIHSVEVNDGHAVSCSCPHHVHRDVRCKHIRAVDANPLVVSAANVTSDGKPLTDGGTTIEQDEDSDDCPGPHHHEDEMCDDCTEQSTVEFQEGTVNRGIDTDGCTESNDSESENDDSDDRWMNPYTGPIRHDKDESTGVEEL